jgi:hypothetical protein
VKRTTTTKAVAAWGNLNGGTSNGVSDLSVMDAWSSSSGILGSTIAGWGSLDVNSSQKIKQAVASTGSIYATLNVPEMISWSRLIWSIPTNSSTPLTDHAVALIGWVRQGWIAVSWGEIVLIPWSDWRVEAIGAYVVSPSLIHSLRHQSGAELASISSSADRSRLPGTPPRGSRQLLPKPDFLETSTS